MKQIFSGFVINLKEHKTTIFIVIGMIGIVLILLSEFFLPKGKTVTDFKYASEQEYIKTLQTDLQTMVEGIEGAGNCDVTVTLESGEEYIYATEQRVTSNQSTENGSTLQARTNIQRDTEDKYILRRNSDGSEEALLLKKVQPTIRGVVVLSTGANRVSVEQRITESVMTALGISSNRICVIQKSK